MKAPYAPILIDFESMCAAARICSTMDPSFEGVAIGTPAKRDPRISWRKDRVPDVAHFVRRGWVASWRRYFVSKGFTDLFATGTTLLMAKKCSMYGRRGMDNGS